MRSLIFSLATAALVSLSTQASAQTIGCEVGAANGGAFPTSGTGNGTFPTVLPSFPASYTLNVASLPPGATHVTEVKLIGLAHTWMSDCQFTLTDPSGVEHNVFVRQGAGCDFAGDYTFQAACTGGVSWPATCVNPVPAGAYDQFFGTWPSGTNNIFNTPLSAIPAATGTWTLKAYDWVATDVGTLTSFDVCFGTPLAPSAPAGSPALTAPAAAANVFGPTVNLSWAAETCSTAYDVDVDGTIFTNVTSPFAFASTPGVHTWTVRGTNVSGVGPWAAPRTFTDLGAAPQPCSGQQLTTVPFTGGNGLGANSVVYFDINVSNPAGVNIAQLKSNITGTVGTLFSLEIYTRPGTYVGFEQNPAGWTLTQTGTGISVGTNGAGGSLCEFPDFLIPQGVTGFALRVLGTGTGHTYTNGNGTNQTYTNADMTITLGKSQGTLFSSAPINPRVWNGTVIYNCTPPIPPVVTYCTSGTTTNGCLASISASAQPSVSAANACNISVANVEGQKSGLIFYSITGQSGSAWNASSFLCVKAPTQRTGTQVSGGTVGACDGTLSLDWNAYQAGNPTALGNPFSAGNKVQVQAWFRDPPAGKATNLSNAVELTYVP